MPGFSEHANSQVPLAQEFAEKGYEAHIIPPSGQGKRGKEPFFDIDGDASLVRGYIENLRGPTIGFGNSLGALTLGRMESRYGGLDALIASTVPGTKNAFIPEEVINILGYLPDNFVSAMTRTASSVLNAVSKISNPLVSSNYSSWSKPLADEFPEDAVFGATNLTPVGDVKARFKGVKEYVVDEAPSPQECFQGGTAPILFLFGNRDYLHSGKAEYSWELPEENAAVIKQARGSDKSRRQCYVAMLVGDHGLKGYDSDGEMQRTRMDEPYGVVHSGVNPRLSRTIFRFLDDHLKGYEQ